ncbi:MAG TPA: UPF0149 family protein [Burkholderiaceae bacterium]|jgi:uncharacterized protein|nr:UPF0149 family protein [Burkholderiaceae bacterium]
MPAMIDDASSDSAPLADAEFDRLDELLGGLGSDDAMIVEELDGFLAALACAPEPVAADEYLPVVFGLDALPQGAAIGAAVGDELSSLVRRHARSVSEALDARGFAPVLAYDERGAPDGSAWAVGFLRAVEMAPDSWDALLGEREFGDALDAVEALAATLDDDADTRPPTRRERDALIERMIADVADIHEFFRPYRQAGTTPQAMRVETVRREQPKVGRNEPCPCGSGRKYKACCGRNA